MSAIKEREIEIAIDDWIRGIDEMNQIGPGVELSYIVSSFADLRKEFGIPEPRALQAVEKALN